MASLSLFLQVRKSCSILLLPLVDSAALLKSLTGKWCTNRETWKLFSFPDYHWTGLCGPVNNQQSMENVTSNMYPGSNPYSSCTGFPSGAVSSQTGAGSTMQNMQGDLLGQFNEPEGWRGSSIANLRRKALEHAATMSTFRWKLVIS